jgi:hypothetical protein
MNRLFVIGTLFPLLLFMSGCEKLSGSSNARFVVSADGNGRVIRLNTATGETCVVGDSCDADLSSLVIGDSYIYQGKGKFQHKKIVKFEDLK